jgi:hypothetical protein
MSTLQKQKADQSALLKKLLAEGESITLSQTIEPGVSIQSFTSEIQVVDDKLQAVNIIIPSADKDLSPLVVEEEKDSKGSDIYVSSKVGYAKRESLFAKSIELKTEITTNLPTSEQLNNILGLNKTLVISVTKDDAGLVKILLNPDEPRGALHAFIKGHLLQDINDVSFFGFPDFHSRPPSFGFTLDGAQCSKLMEKITELSASTAKTPSLGQP